MKLIPFLVALTLLGAVASSASAAPRSTTDLCTVAKGVASAITRSGATLAPTAGTSLASLSKELKTTFSHIKAAESVVLANAPSSLEPHFVKVFAFDNLVYSKLSKANWNLLALAKDAKSLSAGAAKVAPDIRAINAYFDKCKK